MEAAKEKAAETKKEGDKEAAAKQKQEIAQAQAKAESQKRSIETKVITVFFFQRINGDGTFFRETSVISSCRKRLLDVL